ncbi:MAG TPA: HAD-IA family hydrolase [Gemmatimonadaceae bacterium]|nr:HAD-IA family hydrolase [Gemmatimonadaceae bacterium]
MPRPAILFDLDGTLLDSIELILSSARYAFGKLGRECPSDEEWLQGVGIPLFTMFGRYARDDADKVALIAAYREHQFANHDRLVRPYEGVRELLADLRSRGHELAVVTSKSEYLAMRGLAHVRLARFFDTIVGCDSTTRHKPDPAPVRLALHRLACDPSDAVFVGDSVHDVIAGNAAGVATIAALWGAFGRRDLEPGGPTAWAERVSEVAGLLVSSPPGGVLLR